MDVSFLKLLINMALTFKYVKANLTSVVHRPTITNLATTKTSNYISKNQVQLVSIGIYSHVYSTINFLI